MDVRSAEVSLVQKRSEDTSGGRWSWRSVEVGEGRQKSVKVDGGLVEFKRIQWRSVKVSRNQTGIKVWLHYAY